MSSKSKKPRHDCPFCEDKQIAQMFFQQHLNGHLMDQLMGIFTSLTPISQTLPRPIQEKMAEISVSFTKAHLALSEANERDEVYWKDYLAKQ